MPALTGIGATFSLDDGGGNLQNLTPDVLSVTINTPRNSQDITALNDGALRRLLLLGDASIDLECVVNDATNASFDVFKTAGTYDSARTATFVRNGHTLTMEMILTQVSWPRAQDGSWRISASLQLASGSDPTWS